MNKGDVFIIKSDNCLYPKKTFIIEDYTRSKLTVAYFDKRTNNKCRCNNCLEPSLSYNKLSGLKKILVRNIEIVQTKLGRERELKLKSILKNG